MGRSDPPPPLFLQYSSQGQQTQHGQSLQAVTMSSQTAHAPPVSPGLHRRPVTPMKDTFLPVSPMRTAGLHPIPLTPKTPMRRRTNSNSREPTGEMKEEAWIVLRGVREVLYVAWLLVTFGLFVVCCIVIDTSRKYYNSYLGANAALLACSLINLFVVPFLHFHLHLKHPASVFSTLLVESLLITSFWVFYLGSATSISVSFPHLSRCSGYALCDQVRALQVLAWTEFAVSTVLLGLIVIVAAFNGSWTESFTMLANRSANGESGTEGVTVGKEK